ncbi:uncharacterized protein LOC130712384 [Lotus japonicus]|uniref:uncharacterized protein LOC130712384 n=1 Tax=Lotus japonicus TaxID=34305 RepID=UPI002587A509|nr:uncharacterized protein LOC130712384 [Lotus japonicus]
MEVETENSTALVRPPEAEGERPRSSFRDMLMGDAQQPSPKMVEDLWETGKMKVTYVNGNMQLPRLHVDKSVIDGMCSPWKDDLVVGLLGKKLGFRLMKTQLSAMWRLSGEFDLLDIGNGFFMVKMDRAEDRKKVMDGGPWMVFDHYLAVAPWSKDFISPAAKITTTLAWIRVPDLNVTFYDESFLMSMAKLIGTPVKVDINTLKAERGRFARICVQLDLTKPVVGKFWFEGYWYKIEYEGLHIICSKCGCYGHRGRECHNPPPIQVPESEATPPFGNAPSSVTPETLGNTPPQPESTLEGGPTSDAGMVGAESKEIPLTADTESEGITETKKQEIEEVDPSVLEVAGDWLVVSKRSKKKKHIFQFGGPRATKDVGANKASQRSDAPESVRPGNARAGSNHLAASQDVGSGGPAPIKSLGSKKRRKGDDAIRTSFASSNHVAGGRLEGPTKYQSQPLTMGGQVFNAGTGSLNSPNMILLKNAAGASHTKHLGTNVEGPYEPFGQEQVTQ